MSAGSEDACYEMHHSSKGDLQIFASDDRSAELFKTKIEAATQMKAVLGADPRPNCLIIDEIDGAPAVSLWRNG